MVDQASIRAVRNRNPLNIRVGLPWKGQLDRADMTPDQAAEKAFVVFAAPKWGFRAAALILIHYHREGVGNLADCIRHWAPPSENDTFAYLADVSNRTGFPEMNAINLAAPAIQQSLLRSMAIHESGGWYFLDADLADGIALAQAAV